MKKKNGFISISIIYSFFIVFLVIMLAMLASYTNKRYLKDKVPTWVPKDEIAVCESGDSLAECIKKTEAMKKGYVKANGNPDTVKLKNDENNLSVKQLTDDTEESGFFVTLDDYSRMYRTSNTSPNYSYYYRGKVNSNYVKFGNYIWRIVRINGNNTVRLIYQGEYNSSAASNESKLKDGNDYIDITASNDLTKYNYSRYNSTECDVRQAVLNIVNERATTLGESVNACLENCEEKLLKNLCKATTCFGLEIAENQAEYLDNLLSDEYGKSCENAGNVLGAHLLHNIGYMSNEEALLYRYDSKYDNQDSSEIKSYIDKWYEKASLNSSMLSAETIFCGDKNRTKCTDDAGKSINCTEDNEAEADNFLEKLLEKGGEIYKKTERYYYSGWERIVDKKVPSLICPDSGNIATKENNEVLNLNRYNVANNTEYLNAGFTTGVDGSNGGIVRLYGNPVAKSSYTTYKISPSTKSSEKNLIAYQNDRIPYAYQNSNARDYYQYYTLTKLNQPGQPVYSYISSLEYLGNGDLTYPIGLLSVDEAVFAGVNYNTSEIGTQSYLFDHANSKEMFWTMTLSYTDYTDSQKRTGAYYFALRQTDGNNGRIVQLNDKPKDGLKTYIYDKYGNQIDEITYQNQIGAYIRPVINLNTNVIYCGGKGTEKDPYKLGYRTYDAYGNHESDICL
ncbi:MAG: hypothetical protein IJO33_05200 [Bacilli bacterium]|nr:hypothetical protein [Bacilli bacterium]